MIFARRRPIDTTEPRLMRGRASGNSGVEPAIGRVSDGNLLRGSENALARGDHFFVWRFHRGVPFQHHAIDMGDGTAVHFSDGSDGVAGPGRAAAAFEIQQTVISKITRGGRDTMHVVDHREPLDANQIVQRAASQVGRRGYHLLFDNCEHFACWCVRGREESRQVTIACERLGAAGLKSLAARSARAAAALGTRRIARGVHPGLLLADVAQWTTEVGGHHVGLRDPRRRRQASRAIGGLATVGLGALGGPATAVVATGMWVAGELAGEASRVAYEEIRTRAVGRSRSPAAPGATAAAEIVIG
jgi:hypothetical protein